jgi:mRNA-degrading endonuclease RelE of RelBE toxin-antitoxin system
MKKNEKWSIQISKSAAAKLKRFCKKHGYKMSGFVESCLESEYLLRKMVPMTDKELDEINDERDKQ